MPLEILALVMTACWFLPSGLTYFEKLWTFLRLFIIKVDFNNKQTVAWTLWTVMQTKPKTKTQTQTRTPPQTQNKKHKKQNKTKQNKTKNKNKTKQKKTKWKLIDS